MANEGQIRLRISGEGVTGNNYRVEVDGMDVSARVTGITLEMHAGAVNKASIEYLVDSVEVEGTFEIRKEAL